MKIETKYSINDEVYFIYDDQFFKGRVKEVCVVIQEDIKNELYEMYNWKVKFNKHELFSTLEELMDNLREDFLEREKQKIKLI